MNKGIELDDSNYAMYRFRGIIKDIYGDKEGACKDLNIAADAGDQVAIEMSEENCTIKKSTSNINGENNITLSSLTG